MPLPVAHGLLGASIAAVLQPSESLRWRTLCVCALLGVCPDFDYALNWLRVSGGGWHHGFTHSILFALFIGSLTAVALGDRKFRSIIPFCAAAASHTLLDYVMTESRGVAMWWPLTDRRFKLSLPNPIDYTWHNANLWGMSVDLLRISLIELMIFATIFLAVIWIKRLVMRSGSAAV
jgi:membrane-bound metal-dependent hydrolase YbcI (DUF457 family)